MKEKTYILNTILAALLGAVLATAVCIRSLVPNWILPGLDIPNMVLLSLAALLLDHYLAPEATRCYICIPVFSAISFGLLPYCAAFATPVEAVRLGILGCAVFTATTWLFSSMMDRLSTGPAAKLAPLVSALGLFLASQCFMGL